MNNINECETHSKFGELDHPDPNCSRIRFMDDAKTEKKQNQKPKFFIQIQAKIYVVLSMLCLMDKKKLLQSLTAMIFYVHY